MTLHVRSDADIKANPKFWPLLRRRSAPGQPAIEHRLPLSPEALHSVPEHRTLEPAWSGGSAANPPKCDVKRGWSREEPGSGALAYNFGEEPCNALSEHAYEDSIACRSKIRFLDAYFFSDTVDIV